MKNLNDLFVHEIKDLYSAEKQLAKALPKMQKAASNKKLKKVFSNHLKETKSHIKSLESICNDLNIKTGKTTCDAMKGLIKECDGMINTKAPAAVKDAGLIACAQRVEHYEISGYGTACEHAKALDHLDVAKKLDDILDDESYANSELNDLAIYGINRDAMKCNLKSSSKSSSKKKSKSKK